MWSGRAFLRRENDSWPCNTLSVIGAVCTENKLVCIRDFTFLYIVLVSLPAAFYPIGKYPIMPGSYFTDLGGGIAGKSIIHGMAVHCVFHWEYSMHSMKENGMLCCADIIL